MLEEQFWLKRSLEQMSQPEWEAICDGCGKCCLNTFIDSEDEDEFTATDQLREGEELIFTNIVCQYLDNDTCGCSEYANRQILVPSCVKLTKENLKDIFFMPQSCSYRRLYEGRGLASWHPLLNGGSKDMMHQLGISVRDKTVKDCDVDLDDFDLYVAEWPTRDID
ncbi:YcgN family cysteine cluster protein [Pseudoalteromonas sp. L1]|uniref:YcgN family cysteine cluster protein n=1 Tax=Pseudoalteromonas sp. L1 TaxID=195716 RepID=UPI001F394B31|nr:YcgN family cysteine cluster protein [Pseudoalteromonas sp. L1]